MYIVHGRECVMMKNWKQFSMLDKMHWSVGAGASSATANVAQMHVQHVRMHTLYNIGRSYMEYAIYVKL